MPSIVPVVEGHGEVAAVPILLRNILSQQHGRYDIDILKPRNSRGKGNLQKKFEELVAYAASIPDCGGILVLLDADDDCAVQLSQELCARCHQINLAVPIVIVCAVREYEAWFLASLASVKSNPDGAGSIILSGAEAPGNPESIRPKEWLAGQMPPGRSYRQSMDQPSLTSRIDVSLASANSRSFRRICHAVEELVDAMDAGARLISPFAARA